MSHETPRDDADELPVRQQPPAGVQVRRSAVMVAVATSVSLLAIAAYFGLQPPNSEEPTLASGQQEAPLSTAPPLPALPADVYPMNLPPPPPVERPTAANGAAVGREVSPEERERQRLEAERQQRARQLEEDRRHDDEAARKSAVLFPGQQGQGPGQKADTQAADAVKDTLAQVRTMQQALGRPDLTFAGAGSGTGLPDQLAAQAAPVAAERIANMQGSKEGFVRGEATTGRTQVKAQYQRLSSPYTVTAGWVISAATLPRLNSDLPGDVYAWVTQNVYDSATGNVLLIPQGTKILGRYDSNVSYGQERALVVWSRLVFPNGASIELENMPGSDEAGTAGIADEVNNHWWRKAGAVVLSSLLTFGGNVVANTEQTASGSPSQIGQQSLGQTIAQNANQTGQQIIRKDMDVQPTIEVRQGWPIRVIVNKDLILQPYEG